MTKPSNIRPRGAADPWMTVEEVMEELGITRRTWQQWRARRCTPVASRLPNGELRMRRSAYNEWLDSMQEDAA